MLSRRIDISIGRDFPCLVSGFSSNPVGVTGAWKLLYCSKLTRLHCPPVEADGIIYHGWTGLGGEEQVSIPWEHQVEILEGGREGGGRGRSQIN